MKKYIIQSLHEAVKNRTQSSVSFIKPVPIYHKDTPIGKFIDKGMHKEWKSHRDKVYKMSNMTPGRIFGEMQKNPMEKLVDDRFNEINGKGISRGRIGFAKKIKYSFHPRVVKSSNKRGEKYDWQHTGSSETGTHVYRIKTPAGKNLKISIAHSLTHPKSNSRKNGILNSSAVKFEVDNRINVDSESKKTSAQDAIGIYRSVLAAVKHHVKSHNPDEIKFSASSSPGHDDGRDRAKLYAYTAKRLIGKKYHLAVKKSTHTRMTAASTFAGRRFVRKTKVANFTIVKRKTPEMERLISMNKKGI